ncbi:MAG: L-aspartate oxidase [Candidatus Melainabacteria bacterium]|nr:L-aspartate oxidase [Candidatus Melainabacteria bacterium]
MTDEVLRMETKRVPVLVIGSGISGLFTVLKLAGFGIRSLLVTKAALAENNSRYAQGGIAAVLPTNPDDSVELHVQDTLQAGAGLCDEAVVRSILADGYAAIADLLHYGVPFDRTDADQLAVTQEAAHSVRRIIHAGGDATGQSVEMRLIEKVSAHPLIEVMEYCSVLELLHRPGAEQSASCMGARAVSLEQQREWLILSEHTILATGGVGRLFRQTTNPTIATGDGLAMAARAGAPLKHMEFVQFHPTAFFHEEQVRFLISEALRGEGAILKNSQGFAFAKSYHPDGELAPRDVVTRAIFSEIQTSGVPYVLLDITHQSPEYLLQRFPSISQQCQHYGVDISRHAIPVAPAAHYLMGGVAVDAQGRTPVPNLYCVGETACTGLHGANRLASNSLLECVVLARRVAQVIRQQQPTEASLRALPVHLEVSARIYTYGPERTIEKRAARLHRLMWESVGIVRHQAALERVLFELENLHQEAEAQRWRYHLPVGLEYVNQLLVANHIARAAHRRKQSVGAHFRSDAPDVAMPQAPLRTVR